MIISKSISTLLKHIIANAVTAAPFLQIYHTQISNEKKEREKKYSHAHSHIYMGSTENSTQ